MRDSLPHVSTWWSQILAAITTGVTNAASEGINRAIKTDAVRLCANAL
ncbi:transposase [Streptomyces sp. NBC_00638]|nr:transposase [Streptomyces sp. NBC_00638]MCX5008487.1 transposase [Streptomyces sp. NBC_00638]